MHAIPFVGKACPLCCVLTFPTTLLLPSPVRTHWSRRSSSLPFDEDAPPRACAPTDARAPPGSQHLLVSSSVDGWLVFYDVTKRAKLREIDHGTAITGFSLSHDFIAWRRIKTQFVPTCAALMIRRRGGIYGFAVGSQGMIRDASRTLTTPS